MFVQYLSRWLTSPRGNGPGRTGAPSPWWWRQGDKEDDDGNNNNNGGKDNDKQHTGRLVDSGAIPGQHCEPDLYKWHCRKPKGVELVHLNTVLNIKGCRDMGIIISDLPTSDNRSLTLLPWAHSYGQASENHTWCCNSAVQKPRTLAALSATMLAVFLGTSSYQLS
jgi:hypothetical protein